MSTESLLGFWFSHNEQLVLWLFAVVLLCVTTLVIRAIFAKSEGDGSGASIGELEQSIKKMLEAQAANVGSATTAAASAAAASDDDLVPAPMVAAIREELEKKKAELQKTKTELETKATEVEAAKKQQTLLESQLQAANSSAANAQGVVPQEVEQLKDKLKEVEGKLSEYAVIEDDIADLSMYKEENQRLKAELEALKGASAAPAAAPAVAPAPPPPPPAETPVAPPAPVQAPAAPAAAAPPAKAASTPVADPVMKEFAEAVASQPDDIDPSKLDTDRMLAEMADLNNLPETEDVGAKILDAEPDTEKMAAEASKLDEKAS